MKIIEKIALILFSYIALFLGIILCLFAFGWLDINFAHSLFVTMIEDPRISKIIVLTSIIAILIAIRCIFFDSTGKEIAKQKDGILLENSDGRLLISRETIESLIASVAKGFNGAENVNSKVYVDKENNLSVYVTLFIHPNAVIKDLSINLQNKIKEAIKKTSDLEVKEVNIKIRDITPVEDNIQE